MRFWKQVVLKQARLIVVHADSTEDHQTVDLEISEAKKRVVKLNQVAPSPIFRFMGVGGGGVGNTEYPTLGR